MVFLSVGHTYTRKKITLVCEQNINLAGGMPCVAHTTKLRFFTTQSSALPLFQLNVGGGDQAIPSSTLRLHPCEWEQWSGSRGRRACQFSTSQPQPGVKAEGRGQVGERPVVCMKMGVPFPGTHIEFSGC